VPTDPRKELRIRIYLIFRKLMHLNTQAVL
jgi:hypothetical protein